MKRLRPPLLLLGLGLLVAFLAVLVVVFLQEDETRAEESAGQRSALEAYATSTARRTLDDEWRLGVALIDGALADPLIDDSRLWLTQPPNQVLLPRRAHGTVGGVTDAMAQALTAEVDEPRDEAPALERAALVTQLRHALEQQRRDEVTRLVRAFLDHRQRYRIDLRADLATTLAVVELLQTRTTPARRLLESLLRDGFGPGQPGLQRVVLSAVETLTPEAMAETCAVVVRQSLRAQVSADDFARRCEQVSGGPSVSLDEVPEALAVRRGADGRRWVLRGGREVRGVEVFVEPLLEAERAAMVERGLLLDDDRLEWTTLDGPLEALALEVDSPRWETAARSRRAALTTKLSLLGLALVLGLGLVAAAFAAQRQERALVEAKSALVSTVSHELRTPLAALRVMAETLERKVASVPEAKDWPSRIVGEVDGLSALVENILAFNRLEQGRDLFQRRPWELAEVREWLVADAPEVTLTVAGLDGLVLDADPSWMKIAFLNLARNARKYNERTPVELTVTAHRAGASLVVEVTDNGLGIAPEHWDDVFEAFHRLRGGRERGGGSGLGLAVVKRVVEAHRGTIRVSASSSEGTTFTLTFAAAVTSA